MDAQSTLSSTTFLPPPTTLTTPSLSPFPIPYYLQLTTNLLLLPIYIFFILPLHLLQTALYHVVYGPAFPGWGLKVSLANRALKGFIRVVFYFGLPREDPDKDKIIGWSSKRKLQMGMDVQREWLPALSPRQEEVLVFGWAKHPAVGFAPAPGISGFMISPPNTRRVAPSTSKSGASAKIRPYPSSLGFGFDPAKPNEKVILYFVGGAYVTGHPLRLGLSWRMGETFGLRVYCANYRKSLSPSTAFPACILDALTAFIHLTTPSSDGGLGFAPKNVVLMGDSAGGGVCLALGRYLGEIAERERGKGKSTGKGKKVGTPGGMILWSPWADLTSSFKSCKDNQAYDYAGPIGHHAVPSHIRNYPDSIRSPYFSPALPSPDGAPRFKHLSDAGVKVYIQTGTAECLLDEDVALARGMKEDGVDVRLRKIPGDIHVGIVFGRQEAVAAMEKDLPEFFDSL